MKPQYTLYRNTRYALAGLIDMLQHESSFRWEVLVTGLLQLAISFVDMPFGYMGILRLSLLLPLFAEAINSSIERTVDLVTTEIHPLAKQAKDLGSAVVFIFILLTTLIWGFIFYDLFCLR